MAPNITVVLSVLVSWTQQTTSMGKLSSYSSERIIFASTLIAVSFVHYTAEFSAAVLDACASLVHETMWTILMGSTYKVQIVLYLFGRYALQWLLVTFGPPLSSVLYCLLYPKYITGFALSILDALCAEKNTKSYF